MYNYRGFLALFLPLFFLTASGCSRNKGSVIRRASDGSVTAADSSSAVSSGSSSSSDRRLEGMESKIDKASHNVGELVTAMSRYKDTMENYQGFMKEYRQSIEGMEKRMAELETHKKGLKRKIEKLDLSTDQFASREKLNYLEEYITVINEKLSKILNMENQDKLLENLSKSKAESQANQQKLEDLQVHFNRLRQETGQIRRETGETGGRIDQLSSQTQQLYELIKQGESGREKLKKGQQELVSAQKKLRAAQKKLIKTVNRKEDETRKISEKALYDSANRLHVNQAYTDSIVLFSRFVDTFPKSKLADNAQYWLGMGYYSLGNYGRAADEFKLVWQKKFPDDSSQIDALFKLGECFFKLNERELAASSFRRVINEGSGNQRYFLLVDGARKYLSEMGESP